MVTFNVDTVLDANTSPWLRGRGNPSWWTYSPSTFATRWPLLVLRGTAMGAESLRLAQSTSTTVWRLLECVLTLQRPAPGERGRCHAKIQRSRTDVQARTGDWAFYIERYYAQKRNDAGKAPDHYLFPAFDPATQSMPTLRQILTSYGYRYIGGDSKATTTVYHLSKPALIAYFADHIDEMRSERGVYLLSNDSDEAGGLADALGKMHFSGRPETAVPCRDTTPAEQRGIDSVFGKPIEVKQEVGEALEYRARAQHLGHGGVAFTFERQPLDNAYAERRYLVDERAQHSGFEMKNTGVHRGDAGPHMA